MPSASSSPPRPEPDASSLAQAAQRRIQQGASSIQLKKSPAQLAREHDVRQEFRRLIDPGILRPNTRDKAIESLKILRTIGDNILREPGNEKFLKFKPTNTKIKETLIERPGALEYAIRMGFRPEVQNFQPFYTFDPRKIEDLRMGVVMLDETLKLDAEKQQRNQLTKQQEAAIANAAKEKIKLAFIDDRRSVEQRVESEQAIRDAVAARLVKAKIQKNAPRQQMPGTGQSLNGEALADPADMEHIASADDEDEEM